MLGAVLVVIIYGSWIYNYLANLVSSNPAHVEVYLIQHYVIKFISELRQVGGFLMYSGFLHQYNWQPQYNWNIVESGVKHHNRTQLTIVIVYLVSRSFLYNHIGGVMVGVLVTNVVESWVLALVTRRMLKLVFDASPLSTQY